MAIFKLQINGKERQVDVEPDTPLLWILRDHLGLLGAKFGCGIGECGACTVLIDDKAIRSCGFSVSKIRLSKITTIEGLSANGDHPVQSAWDEADVPQCGYCQAGQIMQAVALLKSNPKPTDEEIVETMDFNLCRCGAYHRIREAVKLAITKI